MKNKKILRLFKSLILFIFCWMFTGLNTALPQNDAYPLKINLIKKNQADYKTPENTLAAGFSALMNNDLDWYYETLTEESALEEKTMYEEADIDPDEKFKLVNHGDQLILLDKIAYKDGILLFSKGISHDGTIITGTNIFIKEKGLWKETLEYILDENLLIYFDVIPPEEILTAEMRIYPDRWNQRWYRQILDKKQGNKNSGADKITVLCVLENLKDIDGNIQDIEDIDPETLVFNYVVKPVSWPHGPKKEQTIIIKNGKPKNLPPSLFNHIDKKILRGRSKPIMLIRFNKFESMASLENLFSENFHTVTVSGKLKDGETLFRSETKIAIIPDNLSPSKQNKKGNKSDTEEYYPENWWDEVGSD